MPSSTKRIAFLTADSLLRIALVAGLVLAFAWTLRQCARHQPTAPNDQWQSAPLGTVDLVGGTGQTATLKVVNLPTGDIINFVRLELKSVE